MVHSHWPHVQLEVSPRPRIRFLRHNIEQNVPFHLGYWYQHSPLGAVAQHPGVYFLRPGVVEWTRRHLACLGRHLLQLVIMLGTGHQFTGLFTRLYQEAPLLLGDGHALQMHATVFSTQCMCRYYCHTQRPTWTAESVANYFVAVVTPAKSWMAGERLQLVENPCMRPLQGWVYGGTAGVMERGCDYWRHWHCLPLKGQDYFVFRNPSPGMMSHDLHVRPSRAKTAMLLTIAR